MSKSRIIFDATDEESKSVDLLKDALQTSSRVSVIRYAIRLLMALYRYKTDGYTIQVKKGDEVKEVIILML